MARYAVIDKNGLVENVIEIENDFELPGKRLIETDEAGPGWLYQDGAFSEPAPDEPVISDVELKQRKLQELDTEGIGAMRKAIADLYSSFDYLRPDPAFAVYVSKVEAIEAEHPDAEKEIPQ